MLGTVEGVAIGNIVAIAGERSFELKPRPCWLVLQADGNASTALRQDK